MCRCAEQDGSRIDGSVRGRGYQAAMRLPLVALMLLPLAGCVGSPAEGPMDFWRNVTGDPLQGRLPPPGMDSKEYPNLASVPPAPARGAASAREELSRALMEARTQSNQPLVPGSPVPPPP
ncbi:MAG: hypothetical protein JWP20_830, partial [Roseomonas sp.]|nr:hypothetical protein [Roseomonas sp.]